MCEKIIILARALFVFFETDILFPLFWRIKKSETEILKLN